MLSPPPTRQATQPASHRFQRLRPVRAPHPPYFKPLLSTLAPSPERLFLHRPGTARRGRYTLDGPRGTRPLPHPPLPARRPNDGRYLATGLPVRVHCISRAFYLHHLQPRCHCQTHQRWTPSSPAPPSVNPVRIQTKAHALNSQDNNQPDANKQIKEVDRNQTRTGRNESETTPTHPHTNSRATIFQKKKRGPLKQRKGPSRVK